MNKPLSATPPASFGPELFDLLIRGSTHRIELPSIPYRKAVVLRKRLYALRSALREAHHENANLCSKVVVLLRWPDLGPDALRKLPSGERIPKDKNAPTQLIVEPRDSEFASLIRSAIPSTDKPHPDLEHFTDSTTTGPTIANPEDFIEHLMETEDENETDTDRNNR